MVKKFHLNLAKHHRANANIRQHRVRSANRARAKQGSAEKQRVCFERSRIENGALQRCLPL